MTINYICRKERLDSRGNSQIYILIKHEKKNYKIPTAEKCKPQSWEQRPQRVNGKFNGSTQINTRLSKALTKVHEILDAQEVFSIEDLRGDMIRYYRNPDSFELKENVHKAQDVLSFSEVIDKVIHENRTNWSEGHKKKYRSIRTKILEFSPSFKVEDLCNSWWQDYVEYCYDERENSHNTIQTDLKIIKSLCDLLTRDGYKINREFQNISMNYIEPKIEPLSWVDVTKIANLDLTDPRRPTYEDSRFIWVLCAFMGQRWKDMTRISESNFCLRDLQNSRAWYYTNRVQKTKKLIQVPLLDEAVDLLKTRNFKVPKLSQQVVNRDIKEIARIAGLNEILTIQRVKKNEIIEVKEPVWKHIHIHTARHSYATELVKRSLSKPYAEKFVSEMLGHASFNTTWKYLNLISAQKDKMFLEIIGNRTN